MTGVCLTDAQRFDWLRLIRSENIGPRTFRALINQFGGAGAALDGLPELMRRKGGGRKIRVATKEECEREIDAIERGGARLVALGEPDYPATLREIDSPPPLLVLRGDTSVFSRPMVAIVGSRNASAAGLTFAERLARELAEAGHVVVSGLARGVDARSHRASLAAGTIAVLAGGLDKVYPAEHAPLLEQIVDSGVVLSEMPMGWEPRGRDFPRRNRIVSGLALATVVVEAARRSGSLITARFASEQGREVFAVPGSPLDPRAEGANDLLRQGATICTRAADVIEAIAPLVEKGIVRQPSLFEEEEPVEPRAEPLWDELDLFDTQPAPLSTAGHELDEPVFQPAYVVAGHGGSDAPTSPAGDTIATQIRTLFGPLSVSVDELVRVSGLAVADVQVVLLDLELDGRIERHGGNLVSLVTGRA